MWHAQETLAKGLVQVGSCETNLRKGMRLSLWLNTYQCPQHLLLARIGADRKLDYHTTTFRPHLAVHAKLCRAPKQR